MQVFGNDLLIQDEDLKFWLRFVSETVCFIQTKTSVHQKDNVHAMLSAFQFETDFF
jgi:hypothetical protein